MLFSPLWSWRQRLVTLLRRGLNKLTLIGFFKYHSEFNKSAQMDKSPVSPCIRSMKLLYWDSYNLTLSKMQSIILEKSSNLTHWIHIISFTQFCWWKSSHLSCVTKIDSCSSKFLLINFKVLKICLILLKNCSIQNAPVCNKR